MSFEAYDASSAQKRLYLIDELQGKSILYNMPFCWIIQGHLQPQRLETAIKKLIQRHETLRTSFAAKDGEVFQKVYQHLDFQLKYREIEEDLAEDIDSIIDDFVHPFDLANIPLWRMELMQLTPGSQLLRLDIHHIIFDGVSMSVLINDLMTFYTGKELPGLEYQYVDFTTWQNQQWKSAKIKRQEQYWLTVFTGELPVLEMPVDYPLSSLPQIRGNSIEFNLDTELTKKVKQMAVKYNTGLYVLLLTLYTILLHKYSGQEDIVVGTPAAGRTHREFELIIGMFVNTLAMRNQPSGDKKFIDFLEQVSKNVFSALENQDYPFEMLVEKLLPQRHLNRNPLFDTLFALQNFPRNLEVSAPGQKNLKCVPYEVIEKAARFDIELAALEKETQIEFRLLYRTSLYRKETMRRFLRHFVRMINEVVNNPLQKISDIEIISEEEREYLLYTLNATAGTYPKDKTIHELFEKQVEITPNNIALVGPHQTPKKHEKNHQLPHSSHMSYMSYKELNKKSNQLAHLLREKGVQPETIVSLIVERSIEMIIAMIAIFKAGCAYLPIDPGYPQERINYILADSKVEILLTADPSRYFNCQLSIINCQLSMLNEELNGSRRLNTPPQEANSVNNYQLTINNLQLKGTNLAYIIYTSGSTGKPKGVLIQHQNVVRLVKNPNFIDFTPGDRLLLTGAFIFDITTFEIWWPLLNGLSLFMVHQDIILEAGKIRNFLIKYRISILHLIPQLFNQLAAEHIDIFAGLKYFLVGGDLVRPRYVNRLRNTFKDIEILHMYGPTENTTFSTFHRVNRNYETAIPIGKPISNSTVYILDIYGHLQPIGVAGELCTGGDGIARGYLNNPQLTVEKFCLHRPGGTLFEKTAPPGPPRKNFLLEVTGKNHMQSCNHAAMQPCSHETMRLSSYHAPQYPNTPTPHSPIYRTGDLARWLWDKNIEFLGRTDQQVKIRGMRIELGEIENQMLKHHQVKEAVVLAEKNVDKNSDTDKYLCAYLVSNEKKEIGILEFKAFLSGYLPNYMIPAYITQIEKLPLTPTGKINRKKLPKPGITPAARYTPPANETEKKLVKIWSDLLNLGAQTSIGINDNFFQLGGHSLKAMLLISEIHKELNVKVTLAEIFKYQTISKLADYIKSLKKNIYASIKPMEKREYYAISSAQKRMYFLQQMNLKSTSYNMPLLLPLGKDIVINNLNSTLKKLITRHESLRTSFIMVSEEPVQQVHDLHAVEFEIEYNQVEEEEEPFGQDFNAFGCHSPKSQELRAKSFIYSFIRPFDLSHAPLIRSGIIKSPGGNYIWMVDTHHIISDGTSHTILAEDFLTLYNEKNFHPLRLHYKDFSEWQNRLFASGAIKDQKNYWLELYSDIKEIPRLNLAYDFQRPELFTFEGDYYQFKLEREDALAFKTLASQQGGTLYMNALTALNILFYKYTGQTDIIIGSGITGRPHHDLQHIIGMFVNMLAMRNYPQGEKTFQDFLEEVIHCSIKAFENQNFQFEELVDRLEPRRNPARNPLFDISMVVQNVRQLGENFSRKEALTQREQIPLMNREEDENFSPAEYFNKTAKFDMTFFIHEREEVVYINIEYYTGIFNKSTIRRMASHFKNIIKTVIKKPFIKLNDINIISEEEKQQILYEFNNTARDYPNRVTIHELFEKQVNKTPNKIALRYEDETLTYKELEQKANQLAHYLYNEKDIRSRHEKPVGIMMSQSIYRPVSILGILKAGGVYVPLDPALPQERLKYMITDASIGIVISLKKYVKILNRLQWECKCFHTYLCMDSNDIHGEDETERNELMDEELWHHVGKTATDDITGGGWISSYTGEPLSPAEMDEYGDNVLRKLEPLLHPHMRVLEIGCSSGITMFRVAPKVSFYYGTDLSKIIINKNLKQIQQKGHQNIKLAALAAHEITKIDEHNFDLVIINSVIQCFHGHNYLRKIIKHAIDLLGEKGYLFIGDIMDQDKKDSLILELTEFKYNNKDINYTTKTDFSAELFVSREFWRDLGTELDEIENIQFSDKIHTIKNELTKFRYDTLIEINKQSLFNTSKKRINKYKYKSSMKHKYQHDRGILSSFGCDIHQSNQSSNHLAYIIYTSGTTGKPKGVMNSHQSLVNLCYWHHRHYQITEADHATLYASFSFDASVWELFPYLTKGASLYIISDSMKLDIEKLIDYYEKNNITISFLPTQFCEQFISKENHSLRILLTGGDKLNTFVKRSYDLYNNYGPTENTVVTTAYPVEKNMNNIPIGKPIDNTRVYILSNGGFHFQPVGVAGELCISGVGLARGYSNNPELTAEKFDHDLWDYQDYQLIKNHKLQITKKTIHQLPPTGATSNKKFFRGGPGGAVFSKSAPPGRRRQKLYRTGDLARWLSDANIQFLGRIDLQVKIRGFRIELGEIESHLLAIDNIKEAVVIDKKDKTGEKYLCGYIVLEADMDIQEITDMLSRVLPNYMIPSHLVEIDKIPLTPSGKVDRKALPAPEIKPLEDYVPPRDAIEKKLLEIWQGILGVHAPIGIDDNFFELGGHSLKATIMVSKIHKEMNVKVPLAEVFKFQTIRKLVEHIKQSEENRYASIKTGEKKEDYPLTSAQKRLYILQQMELNGTAYNMPSIIPLPGEFDKIYLENTFKKLIERHESLRTSFLLVKEEPVQRIHDKVDFEIEYFNTTTEGAENTEGMASPTFVHPFDLSFAPLLRVGLIKTGEYEHMLIVDMHHIITDGTSQDILTKEFMVLYSNSNEKLPPLRLQYKDYAEWWNCPEQQEPMKQQGSYWNRLFSPPDELPVLNLPLDYPRPLMQSFAGYSIDFTVNQQQTQRLKDMAKEAGATFYMVLLSVYTILLSKLSGQEDIIVGTPIAARRHADLKHIIGMFVNTLAIRNYPSNQATFKEFLIEVKKRTLEAFENQEYPFEDLVDNISVRRDTSRNPIFDVMFNLLNQAEYSDLIPDKNDQNLYSYQYENELIKRTSKFDLNLTAIQLEDDERLLFNLEYCTKLFKASTIDRIIRYFKNILSILSADADTFRTLKLSSIELLTNEEKQEILQMSRGYEEFIEPNQTIHHWFEEQVEQTPDHIAVVAPHQLHQFSQKEIRGLAPLTIPMAITYKELNQKSNQLSRLLSKKGVKANHVVGLMIDPSVEMIIGILAILKAGGAYLPIEAKLPANRKKIIIKESATHLLLVNHPLEDLTYLAGESIEIMDVTDQRLYPGGSSPLENNDKGANLVYVLYTSGSTGIPKGVMLEHRNLVNLIRFHHKHTQIDCTRVTQFASIGFDASFHEIFSTLLAGGTLFVLDKELKINIPELCRIIRENDIKTVFLPISFLKMIFSEESYAAQFPCSLRHIQTAGEQVVIIDRFRQYLKKNNVHLHNHYGPSETHVVTALKLEPHGEIPKLPSIGRPISNTNIYILDKTLHFNPIGVAGELYAGGIAVGRGYLNNPELTAEKFDHDFWDYQDKRKKLPPQTNYKSNRSYKSHIIYKTGDLGKWLPDGNIEFLGRIDHQVKIRGFRIELGEVETQLMNHPVVKEVVVTALKDDAGDKHLCAYMVCVESSDITGLREFLTKRVPDYMVPSYFVTLDKIPLTPNRKVDRQALPKPESKAGGKYAAPQDEVEKKLVNIWSEILGRDASHASQLRSSLGIDDNFFELGGHSLKATVLAAKIHKVLGVKIPLGEIFKTPSIRGLAQYLQGTKKAPFILFKPSEEKTYYPLSSLQKGLYIVDRVQRAGTAYNLPVVLTVEGSLKRSHLEKTFQRLIQRHQSLRTSFEQRGNEVVQRVHRDIPLDIEYSHFNSQDRDEKEKKQAEKIIKDFVRPFDLKQAPLLRIGLIKLSQERHLLLFDIHHIIADGISLGILVRDVVSLYEGKKIPPLRLQYKDFARWQNSSRGQAVIKQQESYWLNRFKGEIPQLSLYTDWDRPSVQGFEGKETNFILEKEIKEKIRQLNRNTGTTLYMLLLAVFNILLSKYSGQEDIVVGTPIAGREHTNFENIIGLFINALPMRNFPEANKTFLQFLKEVKENTLQAYQNQQYPFNYLVEKLGLLKDVSRNPLFDVELAVQNIEIPELKIKGLRFVPYEFSEQKKSQVDITLNVMETDEVIHGNVIYSTALFRPETIQRFIDTFKSILTTVLGKTDVYLKDIHIVIELEELKTTTYNNGSLDFDF